MVIKRFDVWLIDLELVRGSEISKTRPCVVISPDKANDFLRTVTVAALTSTIKRYPTRVDCQFQEKEGQVALDQIRSVDKTRLIRKIGLLDDIVNRQICERLTDLFLFE